MAKTITPLATKAIWDGKQFQLGMEQSVAQARRFKLAVEGNGLPKLDAAVKEIGHDVTRSTRAVSHFIESFAKIAGVGFIAYEAGAKIRELFDSFNVSATDRVAEFMGQFDGTKPKEEIEKVRKQVKELASDASNMRDNWSFYIANMLKNRQEFHIDKEREGLEQDLKVLEAIDQIKDERASKDKAAKDYSAALGSAGGELYTAVYRLRTNADAEQMAWTKKYWEAYLQYAKATDPQLRALYQQRLAAEVQAHDLAEQAKLAAEEKTRQAHNFELGLQVAGSAAGSIRAVAALQQNAAKRIVLERRADEIESAMAVAELRRKLESETDAEARKMLQQLIGLEGVRAQVAGQRLDQELAADEKRRREEIIGQRKPLSLLRAGTAEAQAFVFDRMSGNADDTQTKLLKEEVDQTKILGDIKKNTADSGFVTITGW